MSGLWYSAEISLLRVCADLPAPWPGVGLSGFSTICVPVILLILLTSSLRRFFKALSESSFSFNFSNNKKHLSLCSLSITIVAHTTMNLVRRLAYQLVDLSLLAALDDLEELHFVDFVHVFASVLDVTQESPTLSQQLAILSSSKLRFFHLNVLASSSLFLVANFHTFLMSKVSESLVCERRPTVRRAC